MLRKRSDNMEKKFKDERVLIGQGKQAKVFLWNGFAYKCFQTDYPHEWIDYEFNIQNSVSKTGLPIANYYQSEIPCSIKMDYIDGVTLADRMRREKYKNGLDDLFEIFLKVHEKRDVDVPRLIPYLLSKISSMDIDSSVKEKAIEYISDIDDDNVLCHLDCHFLNLIYCNDTYYIIDWVNAKLGNPVYDFARTYVIMYEFVNRLSKRFEKMVMENCKFEQSEWNKAVFIMAVHRLSESDSEKTRQLVGKYMF